MDLKELKEKFKTHNELRWELHKICERYAEEYILSNKEYRNRGYEEFDDFFFVQDKVALTFLDDEGIPCILTVSVDISKLLEYYNKVHES